MRAPVVTICILLAGCSFHELRSRTRPIPVEVRSCTGTPANCAPTPPPLPTQSHCNLWPVLIDGALTIAAGSVATALDDNPVTFSLMIGGPLASMIFGFVKYRICTGDERPPLPGRFHVRAGRYTAGISGGPGMTWTNGHRPQCTMCDANGGSAMFVGRMLTSRLEVLAELRLNTGNLIDSTGYPQTVTQNVVLLAAQYWVTRNVWLRGGVGPANVEGPERYDFGAGLGAAASVGFEVMSRRNTAVDIILGGIRGQYGWHEGVSGVSAEIAITFY